MKKLIAPILLQKARKVELPTILSRTLDIVSVNDPKGLKIEGFYEKLLVAYQQHVSVKQINPTHPLSKELQKQRKRRLGLIDAIVKQAVAVENVEIASQQEAALLILPVIKLHLYKFKRMTLPAIHDAVLAFTTELKQGPELMTAAEGIGVKVYIEHLIAIEDSIVENTGVRNKENSKRRIPLLKKLRVKEDAISAFQNLMFAIELARVENTDIDYFTLIAELNQFFVSQQAEFKTRITRSKTALAKKTMTAASSTTTSATAE